MADFSPITRFGAPARPQMPRTVTYHPDSISAAQSRAGALGTRVIGQTLGVAAWLLGGVALLVAWSFTASLATTWGQLIMLAAIGTGIVCATAGLPVAAAVMERSYPQEARRCMQAWLVALLAIAVASAWTAGRLERPGALPAAPRLVAAPLAPPVIRTRFMTAEIWASTAGCTQMQTLYHEMSCEEFTYQLGRAGKVQPPRGTVAAPASWDLSPAGVLGVSGIGDGLLRRILVLGLMLIATAGSGILGRWSVLASSESYRLGEGMASAPPQAPLPAASVAAASSPGVVPPADPFGLWAEGRLIPDASAEVAAEALWNDYATTMQLNGLQGMSQARFFNALTDLAKRSGGRIVKVKNDTIRYRGVRLAGGGSAATQADSAWLN